MSGQHPVMPAPKASARLPRPRTSRIRINPVSTSIDVYPKCSCDGTCTDCAHEMAGELQSVLAVLNTVQYDKNPYQLPLVAGGVAELVAQALWGPRHD